MWFLRSSLLLLLLGAKLAATPLPSHFVVRWKKPPKETMSFFLGSEKGEATLIAKRVPQEQITVFVFYTSTGEEVAYAKILSLGRSSHVEVFDKEGDFLGRIEHKTHPILPAEYRLFDAANTLKAQGEMNWLNTRCLIKGITGEEADILSLTRPYFRVAFMDDFWHVEVHNKEGLKDPLFWMVGVLQTDLTVLQP